MFLLRTVPPTLEFTGVQKNILEGGFFTLDCSAVEERPSLTYYKWTRSTDDREWTNRTLSLQVGRSDDALYTCNVSNVMLPTGFKSVIGFAAESFHLNVQCNKVELFENCYNML